MSGAAACDFCGGDAAGGAVPIAPGLGARDGLLCRRCDGEREEALRRARGWANEYRSLSRAGEVESDHRRSGWRFDPTVDYFQGWVLRLRAKQTGACAQCGRAGLGRLRCYCSPSCELAFYLRWWPKTRWEVVRRLVLKRAGGRCAVPGCAEEATEADHVREIADGGDEWDPQNLQALCRAHHAEKSAASASSRAERRRGARLLEAREAADRLWDQFR